MVVLNLAGVAPRERRVSRNRRQNRKIGIIVSVAPRERRVSRNLMLNRPLLPVLGVAPRERRVSRNDTYYFFVPCRLGRASREARE